MIPWPDFKASYLEKGMTDYGDINIILEHFESSFLWNQLVFALQFSFKMVRFS